MMSIRMVVLGLAIGTAACASPRASVYEDGGESHILGVMVPIGAVRPVMVCDGDSGICGQVDMNGLHVTGTFTPAAGADPALLNAVFSANKGQLSDAGTHLASVCATNRDTTNAADYLLLYNSASNPVADASATITLPLPVSTSAQLGFACFGSDIFGAGGVQFSNGLTYCYSTIPQWCSFGTGSNVDVTALGFTP